MNKVLVTLLLLMPGWCSAQHYEGYARSCYGGQCEDFFVSSAWDGTYRTYRIKNISDERYTVYLFTRTTAGKWVSVGSATLDPDKKKTGLMKQEGTDRTILFYFLAGRREEIPTAEEINRIESAY